MRAFFVALSVLSAGCQRRDAAGREESAEAALPSAAGGSAAAPTLRITFTARDPHALCRIESCRGPAISIRPLPSGRPLVLSPDPGLPSCSSCTAARPGPPCSPMGVGVEREELAWDGSFYELSTCGSGAPCAERRLARPGRYAAELCAVRNTRTNDSIGAPVCVDTGARVCGRVEFDFPGPDASGEL